MLIVIGAVNPHESVCEDVIIFMNVDTAPTTLPGDIEIVHITFSMQMDVIVAEVVQVCGIIDRDPVTVEECCKLFDINWCRILDEEQAYNVCRPGVDRTEPLFNTLQQTHGETVKL